MSVDSIASSSGAYQPPQSNPLQQLRSSFNQLTQSLGSGDLSAAQQAFSALQQNLPPGQQNGSGPFASALQQIGQSLQSGDLSGAQKALASLQQNGKAHHHGHHHHGGTSQTTAGTSNATTASVDSDGDKDGSSSHKVNVLA